MDSREKAKIALVVAGSVMAAFILFEVFLQLAYPSEIFSGKNQTAVLEGSNFTYTVTTNSRGIRESRDYPRENGGVERVAVIGDSFAFGHSVDNEETIDYLLEQKCGSTEFLNFGIPGVGPYDYFEIMEFAEQEYDPDSYLVVVYLGNDFLNSYEKKHSALKQAIKQCRSCMLFYSLLVENAKQADPENEDVPANVYHKALDDPAFYNRAHLIAGDAVVKDSIAALEEGLVAMENFSGAKGKKIVFVGLPSPFQVSESYYGFYEGLGFELDRSMLTELKPQEAFAEICARNSLDCYDISEGVIGSAEKDSLYWQRDEHFNEKGYALAAGLISENAVLALAPAPAPQGECS